MPMWRSILGTALCFVTVSSVLADEVLYCSDTAATGFVWEAGSAKSVIFNPERFTIKVRSDTRRVIGDNIYTCRVENELGRTACEAALSGWPWIFHGNTYTRAFLLGPPAGSGDLNIAIAYGTCTKF
jgi:hypothetical protein